MPTQQQRVVVVVLGDLGRSPRMQYHAVALAAAGFNIDLIGLAGSPVVEAVSSHSSITCHRLSEGPAKPRGLGASAARVVRQWWQLSALLLRRIRRPNHILMQTPPIFPSLLVAQLAAWRHRANFVIDWHNFSHTILALQLGRTHVIVRALAAFERNFGRLANQHLCVSEAMRKTLAESYGVRGAIVLRDRPLHIVKKPSQQERGALCRRLGVPADGYLVVTSTSWTPDENIALLVESAERLATLRGTAAATVTFVITGKGPLREAFESNIDTYQHPSVHLQTLWVDWQDYPALLASADVGVSLHTSSSGVDLPMKILDMFGCGLPVCAFDYGETIRELVEPGRNGLLFRSADELATEIHELLGDGEHLARLRQGAAAECALDWQSHWRQVARPIFS